MPITERVKMLRQQSLDAKETLSSERAELLTAFYKQETGLMSEPVRRAKAFAYILEHKYIEIYPGELIVGEKGNAPKTAPTFPELCCHSLQDLDILDSREKTSFRVEPATRRAYEQTVIPYWCGTLRSMRELILNEMTDEWKAAYEAGIFTEFMEQRAPGHSVLDDKIYHKGMLDFQAEIECHLATLDFLHDPEAYDKQQELITMRIAAKSIIRFADRYAELARRQAEAESDPQRRARAGENLPRMQKCPCSRTHRCSRSAAILLVCPSWRDYRTQHMGCILPW